jgi:vitamin B12 transporter
MLQIRYSVGMILGLSILTDLSANNNVTQEKPVVITATRTPQTADASLASMTVITREDIKRQQVRSIQDLFRGLPGISISNSGGAGKFTDVFMRGAESDHVLVMINNIKVGSATSGTTAFENIPIDQIERIEIVRGPRSSLYGSEAIGGVIHIFTRKGGGEKLTPSFNFGGGTYGTLEGSASLSHSWQQGWLNLTASGIGTRGFNSCNGTDTAGCFTFEPDRDGYRNVAGSFRGGYRFQNGLEIDGNFTQSSGKTEYDGSFVNKATMMQQVFGGTARYSPTHFWRVSLIGGLSREDSDNFLGRTFLTRFNTARTTVSVLNEFTINPNHRLTIGMDFQNDRVSSTEAFTVNSRTNWGVFAQHQATIAKHDFLLSIRHDDNQQFGSRVTGNASWGYPLTENIRLLANFGSAFKAPTFNELYFPGFSNPNLRPEDSRSYEFGSRGKTSFGDWSLNFFENNIYHLIAFDSTTFTTANIDQARIRGLEGIINGQIKEWIFNTNVTLMDTQNRSDELNRGNILPRRAEQSFRINADRQFGHYMLGATLLVEGQRYDNIANTLKLDSYIKFDLRAEYIINKHWRLQGRIENLFNERYETAAFFNQPGRNFIAMVRYQP